MSKTITMTKKQSETSALPIDKQPQPQKPENMPEPQEKQGQQQLLHISKDTYVASLQSAMASAKYALNMQLAVSLSVFLEHGGTTRGAKRYLYQIYDMAGWDCSTPESTGYKTVSRRVFSAALLYNHIGGERIAEVVGGNVEGQLIQSLVEMLMPMQISSVDNLLAQVGRPRAVAAPTKQGTAEKGDSNKESEAKSDANKKEDTSPQQGSDNGSGGVETLEPGEIKLPESVTGSEGERDHTPEEEHPLEDNQHGPKFMRRLEDIEGVKHLDSDNVHINIAPTADRNELTRMAMALLELAERLDGDKEPEHVDDKPLQAELRNVPEPMKKPRGRKIVR